MEDPPWLPDSGTIGCTGQNRNWLCVWNQLSGLDYLSEVRPHHRRHLLNGEGVVVYRGRLDNSPRNAMEATTRDLADAMDSLSMGELPPVNRTESIGCSVKWKL